MKEKILALLKTKFPGVDEAILIRLAEKRATGVTDENQITTITEGVSFQDVLNSYGDFRANSATVSATVNYEKKHGLKDGKPIENPNPNPNPNPQEKKDEVPAWAQSLIDSNKTLSEKLAGYEQKEAQTVRGAQISAKAKEYGIPESQAKRYAVPDDADLDAYFKEAKQELANEGFKGVQTPDSTEAKIKTEGESIANMINEGTKTFVEQNKD